MLAGTALFFCDHTMSDLYKVRLEVAADAGAAFAAAIEPWLD